MNEILTTILTNTYTLSQLKHRVKILKVFIQTQLFTNNPQPYLTTEDSSWLSSLPPPFFKQFNKDNLDDIFLKLEKEINQLPLLLVYLPFETNDQIITQIGQKVRTNFGLLIFDTKFDSRLIAGCALSWKGLLKDYSLKAKIEERKKEVTEGFKKYLR